MSCSYRHPYQRIPLTNLLGLFWNSWGFSSSLEGDSIPPMHDTCWQSSCHTSLSWKTSDLPLPILKVGSKIPVPFVHCTPLGERHGSVIYQGPCEWFIFISVPLQKIQVSQTKKAVLGTVEKIFLQCITMLPFTPGSQAFTQIMRSNTEHISNSKQMWQEITRSRKVHWILKTRFFG